LVAVVVEDIGEVVALVVLVVTEWVAVLVEEVIEVVAVVVV
jgi:hypothetical protein